jgi:hypothetical protein
VEELGLVGFFGNSGLGVPRGKPTSSRSNSSNVKEMVRAKQPFHREREIPLSSPPSAKLRIEDVCSTDLEIGNPPPRTGDGEDGEVVADSDIDGETAMQTPVLSLCTRNLSGSSPPKTPNVQILSPKPQLRLHGDPNLPKTVLTR